MKAIFLYITIISLFPSKLFSQIDSILYGKWRIFKVISADYKEPKISKEEIKYRIDRIAVFTKEAIYDSIYPNQSFISKDPQISVSRESAAKIFNQDASACRWAGYKYTDSLQIIKSNAEVPFGEFILINKHTIMLWFDGFYLYMKKEN